LQRRSRLARGAVLLSRKDAFGSPKGEQITFCPKSTDLAGRDFCHEGLSSEVFALVDIRQMHFYGGLIHCGDRIPYGNAGMRICGRVYNQNVVVFFMDDIKDPALAVQLNNLYRYAEFFGESLDRTVDFLERRCSINIFFPFPEKVEIRSMYDEDSL
jgi:hypothetical protein